MTIMILEGADFELLTFGAGYLIKEQNFNFDKFYNMGKTFDF